VKKLMDAFPTISVPAASEGPGCPMCGATMRLVWIVPDRPYVDRHTLECRTCKQLIEVAVERDDD
jgi:C4-type Zn-finger protein